MCSAVTITVSAAIDHDGIEVARGQRVGEVAEVIGQKGVNQGKLRRSPISSRNSFPSTSI